MIYLFKNSTLEDKHQDSSKILKEALLKNQGIYIKLGQLLATLDVLIPTIYRNELFSLC